jgi:hypothetical protein
MGRSSFVANLISKKSAVPKIINNCGSSLWFMCYAFGKTAKKTGNVRIK